MSGRIDVAKVLRALLDERSVATDGARAAIPVAEAMQEVCEAAERYRPAILADVLAKLRTVRGEK